MTANSPAANVFIPLRFHVTGMDCADCALSVERAVAAMAAVESLSEHPLARAVAQQAREEGVAVPAAERFLAVPGKGASARVQGEEIVVGSQRLARDMGLDDELHVAISRIATRGATPLFVAAEAADAWCSLGVIAVADRIRHHAADAARRMREAGVTHVVVLTGDTSAVGDAIALAVEADAVFAELLPDEKAAAVRRLREQLGPVAMVGDGINDAPALATADVGIAMGAAGTDIALMGDDLNGVAEALSLSRRTDAGIRQNIQLSLATRLLAVALAAFGFVNLWIAAAADMGTSLAVTLNGMRLALPGRGIRGGHALENDSAMGLEPIGFRRTASPTLAALRMSKNVRAWPGIRGRKARPAHTAAAVTTLDRS